MVADRAHLRPDGAVVRDDVLAPGALEEASGLRRRGEPQDQRDPNDNRPRSKHPNPSFSRAQMTPLGRVNLINFAQSSRQGTTLSTARRAPSEPGNRDAPNRERSQSRGHVNAGP